MLRIMYKSKIQRATITETQINYAGSIGIDEELIKAANILPNEKVQVLNLETGVRFETYVIEEAAGSGIICLYGPAARLGKVGEKVFIIAYCLADEKEAPKIKPRLVCVDEKNKIKESVDKNG